MELKIILSDEEQAFLKVEQAEFSEADALHLLFDATELLTRNTGRMDELRGQTSADRTGFNQAWHTNTVLSDLVDGLERVTTLNVEKSGKKRAGVGQ